LNSRTVFSVSVERYTAQVGQLDDYVINFLESLGRANAGANYGDPLYGCRFANDPSLTQVRGRNEGVDGQDQSDHDGRGCAVSALRSDTPSAATCEGAVSSTATRGGPLFVTDGGPLSTTGTGRPACCRIQASILACHPRSKSIGRAR
jgi:hypothetical protein